MPVWQAGSVEQQGCMDPPQVLPPPLPPPLPLLTGIGQVFAPHMMQTLLWQHQR